MKTKDEFIKILADYLVRDQGMKSMQLEAGMAAAKDWAKLRDATPLFGYVTVEEAEKELTEFLSDNG